MTADPRSAGSQGRPARSRRSCLAVPGSSPRMLAKAPGVPADEVFLDLEDAVAPAAKEQARDAVVAALTGSDWSGRTVAVRINDVSTPWAYRDVLQVVEGAGAHLDALLLPKVRSAAHVQWLDLTLTSLEQAVGLEVGRIAIEAQIEDAAGLVQVDAIAAASPRLETLVFGPADFMASVGLRTLVVGQQPPGYPADAYHYVLMRLLVAARAHGLQVLDGPYLHLDDPDGLVEVARRSAALGFDGKWAVHPSQIDTVNAVFAPSQQTYDAALRLLDAYEHATSAGGGHRGAVRLGGEMIDEASRKLALAVAAQGRAAGLHRSAAADAGA